MVDFYQKNHKEYFESTVGIDPSTFLSPLADRLSPGAKILDIGCGSGRDLLWLKNLGFKVAGFERSSSLATLAQEHAGCHVIVGDYLHYDFSDHCVDALILIGALVHQSRKLVPIIIQSLMQALKPEGYILITMKEGNGVNTRPDGRQFTLWQMDEIEAVYNTCNLNIVDFSKQISKLRKEDVWLGHVLKMAGDN